MATAFYVYFLLMTIFMVFYGAFLWWCGSDLRRSAAWHAESLHYIEAELAAALHELEHARGNHAG